MNPEEISRSERLLKVKVKDVMNKTVITIDHNDLIGKASRLMLENRLHALLVIKDAKPKYMISAYDLMKVSYEDTFNESNADMLRTTVEELVKNQNLLSLPSSAYLIDALKIFVDYQIHSIPIIDEGTVNGIVSLMDLAGWYLKTHEELRRS
ncbi:CBS domain-containing protein [Leptospira sp. GIMC2001]|uniref:CBS domain-containing protein n=1 Tax=Leptospira sp. GIMC2001 TaxID=1513297 RepID=UPI00234A4E62|nr:CBS domain-containing protein [Leptospira sp. GIMC2001]WCL50238.1 CBS domain-containing protein [Leptospira sp. GIMC2001]